MRDISESDWNASAKNTPSGSNKLILPPEVENLPGVKTLRENLLKEAKNGQFVNNNKPSYIYDFLTTRPEIMRLRDSGKLNWQSLGEQNAQQKNWYNDSVEKLEKKYKWEWDPGWMWIVCHDNGQWTWPISYKWYRTVPIKSYSFLQYIPDLVSKLSEEWRKKWAKIQLKIPRGFLGYMQHNDSIVIHCDDQTIDAENILETWSNEHHLAFEDRYLWRTTHSLDGTRKEDSEKTSFTHLVERQIMEHGNTLIQQGYNHDDIVDTMIIGAIDLSRKKPNI